MSKDHDLITGFIEIYPSFPCLWKNADPQYHNTVKRENAYKTVLEKYNEYDPNATKLSVLRKSCFLVAGLTDFNSSIYVSSLILKYFDQSLGSTCSSFSKLA
jgi:hypothetical protein